MTDLQNKRPRVSPFFPKPLPVHPLRHTIRPPPGSQTDVGSQRLSPYPSSVPYDNRRFFDEESRRTYKPWSSWKSKQIEHRKTSILYGGRHKLGNKRPAARPSSPNEGKSSLGSGNRRPFDSNSREPLDDYADNDYDEYGSFEEEEGRGRGKQSGRAGGFQNSAEDRDLEQQVQLHAPGSRTRCSTQSGIACKIYITV